ncbi:MAG: tetratricopeptide repeat protein [Candidatus Brocadiia bacterium]
MRTPAALALACSLLCALGCSPATRARRAIQRGDAALVEGRYAEARSDYLKALELRPGAEAAFKNAYCLSRMGDRSASLEALAQAMDLGMDGARLVLASYGGVATDDIREYVRNNDGDPYAWTALGERHFRNAEYTLAVQCYETGLANCDNAALGKTLCYNLSLAYLKLGRFADAGRALDDYVARTGRPLKDHELLVLGAIRYGQRDHAGAATAWAKLPLETRRLIAATVGDENAELAGLDDQH